MFPAVGSSLFVAWDLAWGGRGAADILADAYRIDIEAEGADVPVDEKAENLKRADPVPDDSRPACKERNKAKEDPSSSESIKPNA